MVGGGTTVRGAGEELFEAGCLFCVHILQGLDIIIKVCIPRLAMGMWSFSSGLAKPTPLFSFFVYITQLTIYYCGREAKSDLADMNQVGADAIDIDR